MSDTAGDAGGRTRRPFVVFLPLVVFVVFVGVAWHFLRPGYNPGELPSALIDKPAPRFDLPAVPGLAVPGLASSELRAGKVTVVNVFASWCVPCHQEHPTWMRLAGTGINLVGIAYKDEAENTRRFLGQDGNPYRAVGADTSGRTGIDFGVYGVPETYIVRGDGTITAKITGPIDEAIVRDTLLPAIEKAKAESRTK